MVTRKVIVGFTGSDAQMFGIMLGWSDAGYADVSFSNCKLIDELDPEDEGQIKQKCREHLSAADTFVILIGKDTRYKHKYVCWELEVVIEKGYRIIAVNLDNARTMVEHTCPSLLISAGAIFVPFSPKIVLYAIENFSKMSTKNYYYGDDIYKKLGY